MLPFRSLLQNLVTDYLERRIHANPAGTLPTLILLFGVAAATCGCTTMFTSADRLPPVALPKDKVQVAQATDRIKAGDMLQLRLPDEPTAPLNAIYGVMPDGTIMLPEGRVGVAGKTIAEARLALATP